MRSEVGQDVVRSKESGRVHRWHDEPVVDLELSSPAVASFEVVEQRLTPRISELIGHGLLRRLNAAPGRRLRL